MMLSLLLFSIFSQAAEVAKPAPTPVDAEKALEIFLCGKERAKGIAAADWALVDEIDGSTKLYQKGVEVKEDDFDVASGDFAWVITFPGKEQRKLVVNTRTKKGQMFSLDSQGKGKKMGVALACKVP